VSVSWRENTELVLKIVGACIAVFGVYKFFADRADAREIERQSRALSYIESYGGGPIRESREVLFDFWLSRADFVKHASEQTISARAYRGFLLLAFDRDPNQQRLRQSLYVLSNFYDQIYFCYLNKLCNRPMIRAYFCDKTSKFSSLYMPMIEELQVRSGTVEFGEGARELSKTCEQQAS
jgi:hypothetical protein